MPACTEGTWRARSPVGSWRILKIYVKRDQQRQEAAGGNRTASHVSDCLSTRQRLAKAITLVSRV